MRANVDPLTTVIGAAGQVAELQKRPSRPGRTTATLVARLGLAYLQQARETGDPSYYPKADELLRRARTLEPTSLDAVVGLGSLALSRHDFHGALQLGQEAVGLTGGFSPAAKAIVGDAEIELGRYPQAFQTIDELGQQRPSLVSYARQSYALELQGDLPGAADLMADAVAGGAGGGEGTQWTRVQHAALLIKLGRLDDARQELQHALAALPNYARAEAGLGAVAVARGDLPTAERWYKQAAGAPAAGRDPGRARRRADGARRDGRGEEQLRPGQRRAEPVPRRGRQRRPRAGAVRRRPRRPGRGRPPRPHRRERTALGLRARRARLGALPVGRLPRRAARGARREPLESADPILAYHLGAIAACAGEKTEAVAALQRAQGHNPRFHPLYGPDTARLLATLGEPAA